MAQRPIYELAAVRRTVEKGWFRSATVERFGQNYFEIVVLRTGARWGGFLS